MIFSFNSSPDELANSDIERVSHLTSALLHADINGYHLILFDIEVSRWLLQNADISGTEKSRLEEISQKTPTRNGILYSARKYVEVVMRPYEVSDLGNRFVIGYEEVLRGNYLKQPSKLIVENANTDGELYEYIFKNLIGLDVSLSLVNGGGGTMAAMFERTIVGQYISVCISDSDKSFEECRVGSTARAADRVHGRFAGGYLGVHSILKVREAENLIPYDIISSIPCYVHCDGKTQCDGYFLKSDSIFSSQWLFFDIKNGINGNGMIAFGVCPTNGKTWLEFFNVEEDNGAEFSLSGFGDRVLNSLMSCNKSLNSFKRALNTDEWKSNIGGDLDLLVWYFCSSKVMRL